MAAHLGRGTAKSAKRPRVCDASAGPVATRGGTEESRHDEPLLDLGPLVAATVVARPSSVIKSPYVADVDLEHTGERALAHAPGLELGGNCVPGARVLLSAATNASNKTAFAIQLVRGDSGAWIGAHPTLGNRLVAAALARGLLAPALGKHISVQAEVKHGESRVDYVLAHADGSKTLVEVKNVVCADFDPSPNCGAAFVRSGIFPIGRKQQKLPDGTTVVSARAIKHVRELKTAVSDAAAPIKAAIVFVVNRGDCAALSLTRGSCPVLPGELMEAARCGVALHAIRIGWDGGRALWNGFVPCDIPVGHTKRAVE